MDAKRIRSLYEQREAVIRAIDMDQWKHSWHLPKDKHGYVNWFALDTRTAIVEILQEKRAELMHRLRLLDQIQIPPESDYTDTEG